ncbi:hemolysin [Vibrio panuliri]|uniref:Hemolysin n=1 Tax=Vibrio panuliri TaxID=1381081 RepID=A0A1Q9HRN2_9VIBR|nr:DUF333 domain-containing protein [Vibrio panuliri]OLQ93534.1 hemolysin [Vibrio panuliri]
MEKKRVLKTFSLFITAASLGAIVGCAGENSPYKKTEYQTVSNPAAVYCVQRGGELETVSENSQRVTYCLLSDGSRIEQWEYYRQNHQQTEQSN